MSRDVFRFASRGTLLSLVCVAGAGVVVARVSADVAGSAQSSASAPGNRSGETTIAIDQLMPAPAWALAQRALLAANADGVQEFADKYVDARGHLRGPAHWGISDGPDDAVEPIRNWPLAHALGGAESIIDTWDKVWEGHLEQYSRTKVPEVAVAKDGIYYREFTPSFDWEHISEGLAGFYFSGLSRPLDPRYAIRLRRFAGFYLNEDPAAPNYDPKLKIVRSLFNGSRGPTLTPATPDDWDGPAIPGANPARRTRFLKASNIRGDHPAEPQHRESRSACVPRHGRREVPELGARIRRRLAGSDRRQRRQHSVEHRPRWPRRRRVGRQVVRRRVRLEFAGRRRPQLRVSRSTRGVRRGAAADR